MNIIIVGCGKVGTALVSNLVREDHDITVIDTNLKVLNSVCDLYDVLGQHGSGLSDMMLDKAKIKETDLFISVTKSDEVNMLCCALARKLGGDRLKTIARVRDPSYRRGSELLKSLLGINMFPNPEYAAAREIAMLLSYPSAIEIDSFFKGTIDMMRFRVPEGSSVIGCPLSRLSDKTGADVLVCVVTNVKSDEVVIPDGSYVIRPGDRLSIIATHADADRFFKNIGIVSEKIKKTLIVGGGDVCYYLAEKLISQKMVVTIIEEDQARAQELAGRLPGATVVNGDGCDKDVLNDSYIDLNDAFVACTDIDEENIIMSLYARKHVLKKTVTKINHLDLDEVVDDLDLDSIINPTSITVEHILRYVRSLRNTDDSDIEALYKLAGDRAEALEFKVKDFSAAGRPLKDVRTKDGVLVAGIYRNGVFIKGGGQVDMRSGDSVIIVTTRRDIGSLEDILAV